MKSFIDWLYATPLSQLFQTVVWIIPTAQIVHIVALSAIFGSMIMLDFHLLGITMRDRPTSSVADRFIPVVWWALPIMLASGIVLIIAEPNRQLQNVAFYLKMALLLTVIVLTGFLQRYLAKYPDASAKASGSISAANWVGGISLVLWTGIIACGRLIAYT